MTDAAPVRPTGAAAAPALGGHCDLAGIGYVLTGEEFHVGPPDPQFAACSSIRGGWNRSRPPGSSVTTAAHGSTSPMSGWNG